MAAARRLLPSGLAIALILATAGCGGTDSQAYWYSVSNGTERSVIVRFDWLGDLRVNPHVVGHAVSGFGLFHGPIIVLDLSCREIHRVEVTTQRGNLWLRPDETVTLNPTEVDDRAHRLDGIADCASSGTLQP